MQTELQSIRNISNAIFDQRPVPDPLGGLRQNVKIQFFWNMIMLHIKLKRNINAATWQQIFCLRSPAHPHPLTQGSKGQNSTFSEHGQIAYQIK